MSPSRHRTSPPGSPGSPNGSRTGWRTGRGGSSPYRPPPPSNSPRELRELRGAREARGSTASSSRSSDAATRSPISSTCTACRAIRAPWTGSPTSPPSTTPPTPEAARSSSRSSVRAGPSCCAAWSAGTSSAGPCAATAYRPMPPGVRWPSCGNWPTAAPPSSCSTLAAPTPSWTAGRSRSPRRSGPCSGRSAGWRSRGFRRCGCCPGRPSTRWTPSCTACWAATVRTGRSPGSATGAATPSRRSVSTRRPAGGGTSYPCPATARACGSTRSWPCSPSPCRTCC